MQSCVMWDWTVLICLSSSVCQVLDMELKDGMSTTSPKKSFVPKFDIPIKPLSMNNQAGQPTIAPKPKAKQTPVSTPPKVELRTRSGRLVKKPPKLDL